MENGLEGGRPEERNLLYSSQKEVMVTCGAQMKRVVEDGGE
jgi:hypothetical protein